jgi:hypothetical protein
LSNRFNIRLLGRVHLVDDNDVGAPQVHFPWVISQFMTGPVRIHHDNLKL